MQQINNLLISNLKKNLKKSYKYEINLLILHVEKGILMPPPTLWGIISFFLQKK